MKIRYFSKRSDFISNLRTKEAHDTCQFRACSLIKEKIKFSPKFDFYLKIIQCTFKTKSFFLLFPLLIPSINSQQAVSQRTRNPSPYNNPHFAKNFHKLLKIEFYFAATLSQNHPSNLA